jgi:hypothetical protein
VSATAPAPTGTGRNASANNRGSLPLVLRILTAPGGVGCSGAFNGTPRSRHALVPTNVRGARTQPQLLSWSFS